MTDEDFKILERNIRRMRYDIQRRLKNQGHIIGSPYNQYLVGRSRGLTDVLALLCPDPFDMEKDKSA